MNERNRDRMRRQARAAKRRYTHDEGIRFERAVIDTFTPTRRMLHEHDARLLNGQTLGSLDRSPRRGR